MANRHWIGNSGNWSDTSHWSTTSGGSGGASVPTSADDVIFDANSFTATSTVNLTNVLTIAKSFTTQNITNNFQITKDASITIPYLRIEGDIYLSNQFSFANNIILLAIGFNNLTKIGSSYTRLDIGNVVNADRGSIASGNVNFLSSFIGGEIALISGSFTTNGNTIEISNLNTSNNASYTRTIDISNSAVTSLGWSVEPILSNSLISTNSTLYVYNFYGGSKVYNNVVFYSTSSSTLNGSNTYNNLTIPNNKTLIIQSNSTQTINGNFTIGTGSSILTSGGGSNQHTLIKSSGTVSVTGNGTIRGSKATGGATWLAAATVTDGGYNTGWNFAPPPPTANFTANPTAGSRPLTVNFTDTSSNAPTSWLWNFGDGTTSTAQNPSKTYTSVGTYSVSLTANSGSGSGSTTKTNYITTTVSTYPITISGGFIIGGSVNRKLTAKRTIVGGFVMGGTVLAIRKGNTNAIQPKKFIAKVYDEAGNYEGILDDMIEPGIEFTKEINSPGSSVEIELARNSDSRETQRANRTIVGGASRTDSNGFVRSVSLQSRQKVGPGSNIIHNNRVDIWQYYGYTDTRTIPDGRNRTVSTGEDRTVVIGYPNGRIKFSGFISQINTKYGSTETTNLTLMSYGYDLDQYLLDDNTGKTTIAYNSIDPANIMRQGLDRFMAVGMGTYTKYSSTSIDNTSTVVSYTFKANTYNELAKKVVELSPENWYWHVDLGSNEVNLHPRASTAKHVFYLGKHIKDLNLRSSIEGVVNDVLFTGGEVTQGDPTTTLYRRYKRTPGAYTRRGLERMSDSRVTLTDSADTLAEGKIEEVNQVQYKTSVTILDMAYPIEDIEVGDTVGFRNFDNFVDDLILQIVAYTYHPDYIELQLDSLSPPVSKRLSDLKRNQETTATESVPDSPVTA